jgi:hypothetical protein
VVTKGENMIGNWITFTAFGYAALCTIIMLFVHGATKLPELLNWKTAGDQLPARDWARRIAANDRQAAGAAKVLRAPN